MSSSCPPVLLSLSLQILCFTNTSQSSQDVTVLFNLLVFFGFGFIIWLQTCSPVRKPNCVFSLIDGKLNVDSDARCRSLTACFQLLENMLGSEQISFINTRDLVQTYRMMKGLPAGQALGRGQAQSRPPFSFFFPHRRFHVLCLCELCPAVVRAVSASVFCLCSLFLLSCNRSTAQKCCSHEVFHFWGVNQVFLKPLKQFYIRFILVSENV